MTTYTDLLTPQYRDRPKMSASVQAATDPFLQISQAANNLKAQFSLDTATGAQLDVLGLWIGCSRRVAVAINSFFSFNTPGLGFNQGVWQGPFTPTTGEVLLSDTDYRRLLQTIAMANSWDGTLESLQPIYAHLLPNHTVKVRDNFNLSTTIVVTGAVLTPIENAMLTTGRMALVRPAAIRIANYNLPT